MEQQYQHKETLKFHTANEVTSAYWDFMKDENKMNEHNAIYMTRWIDERYMMNEDDPSSSQKGSAPTRVMYKSRHSQWNKCDVINACIVDGNIVRLPNIQIERKIFLEVKSAIGLIGGKWTEGKIQGFVFESDPTQLLAKIKTS